jgi:hypothetical protein
MFSITTPELLNKKQISLYNARGSSSHGSRENQSSILNAHQYQDNDETQRGTVEARSKELGSSPSYLRLPVAVNLKLLATKTCRRLSLTDSLAELLVLTDLEIEMVEMKKKKKKKKKRKPSVRQRRRRASLPESNGRPGPEPFLPVGGGPRRSPRAPGGCSAGTGAR